MVKCILHGVLVELEVAGLIFAHVRQVEGEADEVTLCGIVTLIIIVVNDHIIAVILSGSHVLEVVEVEGVGENVVGVDALEGLTLGHG